MTRSLVPFVSEDGKTLCGTWECEPGASRWEFLERGEFIHVLSGRMTVLQDDGEPVELTAGSSAVFPLGWTGTWTVHETLRKVFTVFRACWAVCGNVRRIEMNRRRKPRARSLVRPTR